MTIKRCGNCRFFVKGDGVTPDHCRAPGALTALGHATSSFPVVDAGFWCHGFKARWRSVLRSWFKR